MLSSLPTGPASASPLPPSSLTSLSSEWRPLGSWWVTGPVVPCVPHSHVSPSCPGTTAQDSSLGRWMLAGTRTSAPGVGDTAWASGASSGAVPATLQPPQAARGSLLACPDTGTRSAPRLSPSSCPPSSSSRAGQRSCGDRRSTRRGGLCPGPSLRWVGPSSPLFPCPACAWEERGT